MVSRAVDLDGVRGHGGVLSVVRPAGGHGGVIVVRGHQPPQSASARDVSSSARCSPGSRSPAACIRASRSAIAIAIAAAVEAFASWATRQIVDPTTASLAAVSITRTRTSKAAAENAARAAAAQVTPEVVGAQGDDVLHPWSNCGSMSDELRGSASSRPRSTHPSSRTTRCRA